MNTTHIARGGAAATIIAIAFTISACGTETATAPEMQIGRQATDPSPGIPTSADAAERRSSKSAPRPATAKERSAAEARMDADGKIPDYRP